MWSSAAVCTNLSNYLILTSDFKMRDLGVLLTVSRTLNSNDVQAKTTMIYTEYLNNNIWKMTAGAFGIGGVQ